MQKKYSLRKRAETGFVEINYDETRFLINYKSQLNEKQFEAVQSISGSFLLIAGAGTGKTRTLVFRVARLIEIGYSPESVLLLTFTRKAAREMMNRASEILDSRCSNISGGTFHSFANIILRKYGNIIKLNPSFSILDQSDSEDIINLVRNDLIDKSERKRFPKKDSIYKIISLSKNTFTPLEKIIESEYPHFVDYTNSIYNIFNKYETYKYNNSLLDYDDLLIYSIRFLKTDSDFVKNFLMSINFLMVDEYQDTNKLQAEMVKTLASGNGNVMVVGDDSQSIYSFRGAYFRNIIQFPELFPNTKVIKLEENYRSTQPILDFANEIISRAIEKFPKNLYSKVKDGEMPIIVAAKNETYQSRFIVDRILDIIDEGISLNDIAILFRSSFSSFELEIELNKAGLPYVKFGGMKFIETAHVKDMISFIRIIVNINDVVSWYRILLLHPGIGSSKASQIITYITNSELPFSEDNYISIFHKNNLLNLLRFLLSLKELEEPSVIAEKIFEYYEPLFKENYDDFNKRKKDLDIFINISSNYKSIDNFLADIALEPPNESISDVEADDKEKERLTLSTIHSAKGLEWHTVFIIHAVDGFFPSSQSLDNLDSIEEERRLMYVAVTRAKRYLHICYPINIFDRFRGITYSKKSRFLDNINPKLVEEWTLEEEE